jgi:hypothetical protein
MKKAKKIKFELAPQDDILDYQKEIDRILKHLKCADSLVTDESLIGDFICFFLTTEERKKVVEKLAKKLKMSVSINDLVIEVAKKLRK